MTDSTPATGGLELSHVWLELCSPLNHIMGYADALIREASVKGFRKVAEELRRIRGMAMNLLDAIQICFEEGVDNSARPDLDPRQMLCTPASYMVGYCEMLVRDMEDRGESDLLVGLQKAYIASRSFLSLAQDILDLSKASAESAVESSIPAALLQQARAAASKGESMTAHILVVDDNEINRAMLTHRLEHEGYTTRVAEGGAQALEMVRQESFDLVLLDILMPGVDGLQVLEALKADPARRHIPVIMISAKDDLDSVAACIELGAEDYLAKPFKPVLLNARISACLDQKQLRDREVRYLRQIEDEKKRSDDLLHVILPSEIVAELKATNTVTPRFHEDVAVLFCDIVGFTPYCEDHPPAEVVFYLQQLVDAYEGLAVKHGLEKIKTIGDAFMATSGLLRPAATPVLNCVRCGLEMIDVAHHLAAGWDVRVGVHVGPVMAGVIGHRQYLFDVWGDTVNVAARIESHGVPGAVNVSATAWAAISEEFEGTSQGLVKLKGKGDMMEIFRVDRPKRTPYIPGRKRT